MSQTDNDALLNALYPFMASDTPAKPVDKTAALQEAVAQKVSQSQAVKTRFFADNSDKLIAIAKLIATSYQQGGRLLTAGNGGSACDAGHLALEFMHPVTAGRPALPAINLSQDNGLMSAVANDVGFEHVLVRQLLALGSSKDTLVVFSTSGNSANISAACRKAKALGMSVAAFSGMDGGELKAQTLTDQCLVVETDSVHRIQECHLVAYHVLWDLVHTLLAESRGSMASANTSQ